MAHRPFQKTLSLALISLGLLVGMSTAQNQIRSRVDLVVVPVTVRARTGNCCRTHPRGFFDHRGR